MTLYALFGLSLAMIILAASPGPGVFTTTAAAAASGFRYSLAVIAGIVLGDLIFLLLAIFGLSAVARILGELFTLVKLCGGLYLIWLGIKLWTSTPHNSLNNTSGSTPQSTKGFTTGLMVTLANPKVILFYCGFLPTFLDLSVLSTVDIVSIAVVICSVLATVLMVYAGLAAQARRAFSGEQAIRRINRSAGGVMIATGATMVGWIRR